MQFHSLCQNHLKVQMGLKSLNVFNSGSSGVFSPLTSWEIYERKFLLLVVAVKEVKTLFTTLTLSTEADFHRGRAIRKYS